MAQNAGSLVKKNPRWPVQQQEDVPKMESGVGQNWPVQLISPRLKGFHCDIAVDRDSLKLHVQSDANTKKTLIGKIETKLNADLQ